MEVRYRRADGPFVGTTLDRVDFDRVMAGLPVREHRAPLKPFADCDVSRIRITAPTQAILQDILAHGHPRFYGQQVADRTGLDNGTVYPTLHRLHVAGWLAGWDEDNREWLAGATEGRGPGRRRVFYALTPEGRRAADGEIADRSERRRTPHRTPQATT